MSIEEKNLAEMQRRQKEYDLMQNLELRVSGGEVEKKSVSDKDTGEDIGIQYIDKKTGEVLYWENAKKINSVLRQREDIEDV